MVNADLANCAKYARSVLRMRKESEGRVSGYVNKPLNFFAHAPLDEFANAAARATQHDWRTRQGRGRSGCVAARAHVTR